MNLQYSHIYVRVFYPGEFLKAYAMVTCSPEISPLKM